MNHGRPVELRFTTRYEETPNDRGWGLAPVEAPAAGTWEPAGKGSWIQRRPEGGWIRLRVVGGVPPGLWSPGR